MTAVSLALFAAWWLTWVGVHLHTSRRAGPARPASLLAYELCLLPFVALAVGVWALGGDAPALLAGTSPAVLAAGLGLVLGAASWTAFTGFGGLPTLPRVRWRRRLAVAAGVGTWDAAGEEVVFRGLLLVALDGVTGSTVAAVAVTAAVFGLHHLPIGGRRTALLHLASGTVFGAVFVWGGLLGAVAAHIAYNLLAVCAREVEIVERHRHRERRRLPLQTHTQT